jgi:hypothetical protein
MIVVPEPLGSIFLVFFGDVEQSVCRVIGKCGSRTVVVLP